MAFERDAPPKRKRNVSWTFNKFRPSVQKDQDQDMTDNVPVEVMEEEQEVIPMSGTDVFALTDSDNEELQSAATANMVRSVAAPLLVKTSQVVINDEKQIKNASGISQNVQISSKASTGRSEAAPRLLGTFQVDIKDWSRKAYIFPGRSSNTLPRSTVDTESEVQEVPISCFSIESGGDYKENEQAFRNPIERDTVPYGTVIPMDPEDPQYPYNSFSISWIDKANISPAFRKDISVHNASVGTLKISVPTLTFGSPVTAGRIRELMTPGFIRTIVE